MAINKYTAFFQKVNTHNFNQLKCWEWCGASKGNGYGHVSFEGRNIPAHRLAYILFCGEVPPTMDVCHTCDNRFCVNPDHLYVGSRKQNMADCMARGRTAGGNRKRLKEHQIQEIKLRLKAGTAPRIIANALDINYETITAIAAGRSYTDKI